MRIWRTYYDNQWSGAVLARKSDRRPEIAEHRVERVRLLEVELVVRSTAEAEAQHEAVSRFDFGHLHHRRIVVMAAALPMATKSQPADGSAA